VPYPGSHRHLGQEVGSLSGGEQQMVARAYLTSLSPVLVDEASFGLSPVMVDQVFATLRDIAATGAALLIVEQYVHRALEVADQVVVLNRGQVLFSDPRPSGPRTCCCRATSEPTRNRRQPIDRG
jgi:branched-chain amino acid transport system ATP-binding protein